MVSSNDMEPTGFHSMRKATKVIGLSKGVIRYSRNNGRDYKRRLEGRSVKVFSIQWC